MTTRTESNDGARKPLYAARVALRWSDMDANGHVNNAKLFTYFEQARIEWLQREGLQNTAENEGPVVVKTTCEFLRPIPYPETIEVLVTGGAPGRTSFPTYYEIVSSTQAGVKYAVGEAIMVWTDRSGGKSRPVPQRLRDMLA
jgi:acyl-CoA thioester hydrolase